MASLATNENGAHFLTQLAQGPKHLDVFAVFGLPAVGDALNHHTLRSHFRIKVMRHLFQREHPVGLTHGPKVPTWAIANQAKEILYALDSDGLQSMQRLWAGRSVSTWNPFADAGTPAALRALDVSCRLPDHYYVTMKGMEDRHIKSGRGSAGQGTSTNLFVFVDNDDISMKGGFTTDDSRRPSGSYSDPWSFPDINNNMPKTTSSHVHSEVPSTPTHPHTQPDTPGNRVPPTPQRRRLDSRGILIGTWSRSRLPVFNANAVFALRDLKGRIIYRIAKENMHGRKVHAFDPQKLACTHRDVDYLPRFQGMTVEQIRSHIAPLLIPGEGAIIVEGEENWRHAATAIRQAAAAFQSQKESYFVAQDGIIYPEDF